MTSGPGVSGYVFLLAVQILFLIAYTAFVRYDDDLLPIFRKQKGNSSQDENESIQNSDYAPSYSRK